MGLRTRRGRPVTKQTWSRLLSNPIYAGWIRNGSDRVRGKHEPLVSEEVFNAVQDRINRKSRPHSRLNEEFPFRGFVKCSGCGRNLTGGWAKGRKERYARYWCWQKDCGAVGVSREELESQFTGLLSLMAPTAEFLAELPLIAAREWETRKVRIGKDAETLSKRLADQETLNRKAIQAKIDGEISAEDFRVMKESLSAESERIREQIRALDSERSTMQDLTSQAQVQVIDLVAAWNNASVNQKQEMAKGLFPEGLFFSEETKFFEPRNRVLIDMSLRWLEEHRKEKHAILNIGVPDGI
ncbi:MAG TPA: recombinase family protein [Terriglobales bacterium]|nr:recombinase family protein [Terriglobales bacterium]